MRAEARRRPASVTVIGWIFIAFAAMGILSGLMALVTFASMRQVEGLGFPPSRQDLLGSPLDEMPPAFHAMYEKMCVLFRYYEGLIVLQTLVWVFVLIAAVQFLKLRAWARAGLEFVTWLGLVYWAAFFVFMLAMWTGFGGMMSRVPVSEGGAPTFLRVFGIMTITLTMLFYAIPLIIIIRFLRGRTIRDAVTGKKADSGASRKDAG